MRPFFLYVGVMLCTAGFLWGAEIPPDLMSKLEKGDRTLMRQLVEAAELPNNMYRLTAARALARMPGSEPLAVLHRWAINPEEAFRVQAILALGDRADASSLVLLKRYAEQTKDAPARRSAWMSLVKFEDHETLVWLKEIANDIEDPRRMDVLQALPYAKHASWIAWTKDRMEDHGEPDRGVILRSIPQMAWQDGELLDVLVNIATDRKDPQRLEAIQGLGLMQGPKAVSTLKGIRRSPWEDGAVKAEAERLLSNIASR